MSATPTIPAPGFADPTRDSQRTFRAVLEALARPTRPYPLPVLVQPPTAWGAALGAIALTLLDEECSVWLGEGSTRDPEIIAWLAFHTGVRFAGSPGDADFVFAHAARRPGMNELFPGTEEAPHRAATVVLEITGCTGSFRFQAEGPGIDGQTVFDAPWAHERFEDEWMNNHALFPRGVDLVLVDDASVAALPRTTRLRALDGTEH